MAKRVLFWAVLFSSLFTSCIGLTQTLVLNSDGTGTIVYKFTVARSLEDMGKEDGNEDEPPVPLGYDDLMNAVARSEGLTLESYSDSFTDRDHIYEFVVSFDSLDALEEMGWNYDLQNRRLEINIQGGEMETEQAALFDGYDFSFNCVLPGTVSVRFLDDSGRETKTFPGTCEVKGSSFNYSIPMRELAANEEDYTLEVNW
jgi:hypothetical protein